MQKGITILVPTLILLSASISGCAKEDVSSSTEIVLESTSAQEETTTVMQEMNIHVVLDNGSEYDVKTDGTWLYWRSDIPNDYWGTATEKYGVKRGYVLYGYNGKGGNIRIPKSINNLPVVALIGTFHGNDDNGFSKNINSVTIPSTIEYMEKVFTSCRHLTSVTFVGKPDIKFIDELSLVCYADDTFQKGPEHQTKVYCSDEVRSEITTSTINYDLVFITD